MPLTVEFSRTSPAGWDDRCLASDGEAGLQQTRLWGDLVEGMALGEACYATVADNGRIVMQALLTIAHPPSRVGRLRSQVMCTDGPVALDIERWEPALDALIEAIERRLLRWRLADIRFEGLAKTSRLLDKPRMADIMEARGYRSEPWATMMLDISGTEEEALARVGRKVREKLRRADRLGVVLREIADADEFISIVNPIYAAGGVKTPVPDARVHAAFAADAGQCYRYVVASDADGTALAVGGVAVWGRIALRVSTSITPAARERRVPAQELVSWRTIQLARALGATIYDLAGVNPAPTDAKEIGIREFKAKWGGRLVEYGRWSRRSGALIGLEKLRGQRVHG